MHNHGTIVGIYIVYKINKNFNITSYPAFVYLEQLGWLKMLILISINILDMVLGLIEWERFQWVMDLVETA